MNPSLTNFRDLGGMSAAEGKRVAAKRLLRSAQPVSLSESDVVKLKEHNLRAIIDFRTAYEAAKEPADTIEGVSYTHIDIMGENSARAADPNYWAKLLMESPEKVEAQFMETYKEFAVSESSRKGYGDFLRACASLESGAVLFHCAAGKDRTGLAAAIILRLLGIADEDIFADYLKTMEYQGQISATHLEKAKSAGMTEQQIELITVIMGVKKEFLAAAFAAIEEKYGSFECYLEDGLGITREDIERLRAMYLE